MLALPWIVPEVLSILVSNVPLTDRLVAFKRMEASPPMVPGLPPGISAVPILNTASSCDVTSPETIKLIPAFPLICPPRSKMSASRNPSLETLPALTLISASVPMIPGARKGPENVL